MVFGKKYKTHKELRAIEDAKVHNWFAWRPMQLHDGKWVWLQKIWREYWSYRCGCGYEYYLTQQDVKKDK